MILSDLDNIVYNKFANGEITLAEYIKYQNRDKMINYEELYKAAIERAKECLKDDSFIAKAYVESIFPELADNEDERIRKKLIGFVKNWGKYNPNSPFDDSECDMILAWLEKQDEKKSTDKAEPKFKVGDWITDGYIHCKITEILDDIYIIEYKFSKRSAILFEDVNRYHLWTIEDAKDGDVLVTSTGQPFIFSGKYDDIHYGNPIAYCGVNWENKFKIGNGTHWTNKNEVAPATKEQRDLLFQKMKEAGYEWDADKKELKKMEVASKESEDEKIRKDIIAFLLSKNRYMTPNEDWDFHNRWLVWLEKQREKLDPDKVIGWLIANICDFEYYVNLFRKDFEL